MVQIYNLHLTGPPPLTILKIQTEPSPFGDVYVWISVSFKARQKLFTPIWGRILPEIH